MIRNIRSVESNQKQGWAVRIAFGQKRDGIPLPDADTIIALTRDFATKIADHEHVAEVMVISHDAVVFELYPRSDKRIADNLEARGATKLAQLIRTDPAIANEIRRALGIPQE